MAEGTTNAKMQGSVERLYQPLVLSYLQLFCVHLLLAYMLWAMSASLQGIQSEKKQWLAVCLSWLGSHQACLRCPWHVNKRQQFTYKLHTQQGVDVEHVYYRPTGLLLLLKLVDSCKQIEDHGPGLVWLVPCLFSSRQPKGVCVHMQVKKKKNFTSFLVHVPAARPYCNSA